MTRRRIAWTAGVFALLVQASLVVRYGRMTRGCFCAVTGLPNLPEQPPHVIWFLELAILPLSLVAFPDGWASAVIWGAVNAVPWFAGICLLLSALVLLCRIRVRPRVGGAKTGRRIHLVDAARVRPRAVAGAALVLVLLAMWGGASYRRRWLLEAHRVLNASVAALRAGTGNPPGVTLSVVAEADEITARNLAGAYALDVDERSTGTHLLDRFVAPIEWEGLLMFRSGSTFVYSVYRTRDGWGVSLTSSREQGPSGFEQGSAR